MNRRSAPDPAAPAVRASGAGLLTGTTVLDLASVGPAARCTRLLSDYGADVVKVAPVPSASGTQIEPPFFAYSGQRSTRRVLVDLKAEAGRRAFLALAARADVVVESFRPGVADRLGVGYGAVRAVNEAVVYCSTSGYGQSGPRAGWAGHDLDYLAVGGYLATSGPRSDGGPPVPGATVADAAAGGMQAALAVAAALVARTATGEGTYLDVSVADGVRWLMSLAIDEQLATDSDPGPGHDIVTGRYACYDSYRTADGRWLAVAAIERRFFANLCRALGCERWVDHQLDDDAQAAIRADFAAAFAAEGRDHWVALLAEADTCVAPVLSVAEVARDVRTEGRVVEARGPGRPVFAQLGPLLAGMVRPGGPVDLPDPSATDTDALLGAAGVDRGSIATWRAEGAIA
jgi:alpha-methylacyl-CoA racemase